MKSSPSITKLANALSKAQAEMPAVKFDSVNPFLKNKYATLGAVIETSRPVLAKHELSIIQSPVNDGDKIGVTTLLLHSSGEFIEDTIFINATDSKGLSVAQSAGVVISYLRRYSLQAFLNMYADEDTDGHKPAQEEKKDQRQGLIDRYSVLTKQANELGVEVHGINPKMSNKEIIDAGKELHDRIEAKKKEGK